jgi:hypothetical protein
MIPRTESNALGQDHPHTLREAYDTLPEIRSANACTGALASCACSTRRTICESVVSLPTRVALMTRAAVRLMVPPVTAVPGLLCMGRDSPAWAHMFELVMLLEGS